MNSVDTEYRTDRRKTHYIKGVYLYILDGLYYAEFNYKPTIHRSPLFQLK
jgi:hypothetical protein